MTSKNNPVHVSHKLLLSKLSTLFFRGSFKVLCKYILLSQSRNGVWLLGGTSETSGTEWSFLYRIYIYNKARSQNYENRLLASSCLFAYPSVRMEQLSYHRTKFHVILRLIIFPRSVDKTRISFKSDNNNGYVAWRPIYIFIISRSFLLRIKNFSSKIYGEETNTYFEFHNRFSKIMLFMR